MTAPERPFVVLSKSVEASGERIERLEFRPLTVDDMVAAESRTGVAAVEAMLVARAADIPYGAVAALRLDDFDAALEALGVDFSSGAAEPAAEPAPVEPGGPVPLSRPVTDGDGTTYTALTLSEPTVADLIEAERERGATASEAALLARTAGVPARVVRRMDLLDFFRAVAHGGQGFFGRRARTPGATRSRPSSGGDGSRGTS